MPKAEDKKTKSTTKKKSSAKTNTKAKVKSKSTKKVAKNASIKAAKKTVKKKAATKKVSPKKDTISKKAVSKVKNKVGSKKTRKRKANLLKLCTEMNKMAVEANDKEIIKRFRIIIDTCEEDITKVSLMVIIKDYDNIDYSNYHESFLPYIKHYIFMRKRLERQNNK